ncbi:MAG: hypothetical protein JWR52_1881 [Marmoricola sp.]|nr:hypothetical protein [Marmoricola sp.]
MAKAKVEQRYGPTSGAITGMLGVLGCLVLAVGLPFAGHDLLTTRWSLGAGAAAVLLWSFMLRPRIIVKDGTLELRNPLSSWLLGLAEVDAVQVRAVTRVRTTSGGSYDAVAVGRPIRTLAGRKQRRSFGIGGFGGRVELAPEPTSVKPKYARTNGPDAIADLMIEQILAAAARAREARTADVGVRRDWAILELVLIGAMLVALALTWLV